MSTSFSHERLIAELAVQRASIASKEVFLAINKGEFSKTDSTPVTIADFAAQTLLISAIHNAFPSDKFVGEEDADALRKDSSLRQSVWELVSSTHLDDKESEAMLASPLSIEDMLEVIDLGGRGVGGREGRVWMLDPVDGTASFLRGGQYAISLALVIDGKEIVGVLGCPNLSLKTGRVHETSVDKEGLGLMLSAVRGEGAIIRPIGRGGLQPARKIPRLRDGPMDLKDLHFVDYTLSELWWHEKVRQIADRVGAAYPGTEVWSSHMRYVALIIGGGDIQVRIPLKKNKVAYVWDHAGTQLIFTEVGGKITDLDGKKIDFGAGRELGNNWGVIAANKGVHARILKIATEMLKVDQETGAYS
jgi:3'(2'), 5'-bisphosphate nucleotidase